MTRPRKMDLLSPGFKLDLTEQGVTNKLFKKCLSLVEREFLTPPGYQLEVIWTMCLILPNLKGFERCKYARNWWDEYSKETLEQTKALVVHGYLDEVLYMGATLEDIEKAADELLFLRHRPKSG